MLTIEQIKSRLQIGEDSHYQFKLQLDKEAKLAEEFIAFSNAEGGYIFVGVVDDTLELKGVTAKDVAKYNLIVSNTASQHVVPTIHPTVQTELIDGKIIYIVHINSGEQKPYSTIQGKYITKSGADKRMLSQAELARLIQRSGALLTEEMTVKNANVEMEFEKSSFYFYFEKFYKLTVNEFLESQKITFIKLLNNLLLAKDDDLTLTGLMLFGKRPQIYKPTFVVKCVCYAGDNFGDNNYLSANDMEGNIEKQFRLTLDFIKANIHKLQPDNNFNSRGVLEIDEVVLQELVVNALVHRDYGIDSPIKVLIYKSRIEIINPGILPNHLDVEKIKSGAAIPRNSSLARIAHEILPYSGLGSGIVRALQIQSDLEFVNDKDLRQFKVVIPRKNRL